VDFKGAGIRRQDWALASLAWLARQNILVNPEMMEAGLAERFKDSVVSSVKAMMKKVVG
jgi:hypothetical protein